MTGDDDPGRLDERVPERAKCDLVAVPEAASRSSDVPVGHVLDEVVEPTDDVDRQPALVCVGRLLDEGVGAGDQPAVERL